MRQIFRDPEQQALFDERGYVFRDFLNKDAIERLRGLYADTAGSGHETYDFASGLSYYISVFDKDPANRRAANEGIREVFEDAIDRLLIDYRTLYCNFMVKEPGAGEIQAHQDYTWVDEARYVAFNLWVPLEDTDAGNGGFHLIAGSNRCLEHSYRAATIPHSLVGYNETLKPYMVSQPVAAGHGIVFDHRLIHYSPDNQSDAPRIAAQLVLIPREAVPVMAHYSPADPEHVRLLEIREDNYLLENNLWETSPDDLPVLETRPYHGLPDEGALIEMIRRHRQGD
jgi:hypothetical protein